MATVISLCFRKDIIIRLVVLTLGLTLVSCSSNTQSPETAAEIRIGMIITTCDERMKTTDYQLLEMVESSVKDAGGITLDGLKHDLKIAVREINGGVPEQAVRAVSELINQERVIAIIGPSYSSDTIPAGELAEQAGIPLIAPVSVHPETTAGRRYVFRMAVLNDFQAKSIAEFCLRELKATKTAVLFNVANPYSSGLAKIFRDTVIKERGEISIFESYVTGDDDMSAQLERINAAAPEVLYLPNYHSETVAIAVKAREMGIDAVLLGGIYWYMEEIKTMPEFEGAYMVEYYSLDRLKGESRAFLEEYKSRYGHYLKSGAVLTYDAIGIVLRAIQKTGNLDPGDIRDALYDLDFYEGVAGKIDFVDSGDPVREAVIVRIENGEVRFQKKITASQPVR